MTGRNPIGSKVKSGLKSRVNDLSVAVYRYSGALMSVANNLSLKLCILELKIGRYSRFQTDIPRYNLFATGPGSFRTWSRSGDAPSSLNPYGHISSKLMAVQKIGHTFISTGNSNRLFLK